MEEKTSKKLLVWLRQIFQNYSQTNKSLLKIGNEAKSQSGGRWANENLNLQIFNYHIHCYAAKENCVNAFE